MEDERASEVAEAGLNANWGVNAEGRICVLSHDSYFSYLLARPMINHYRGEIGLVVLSKATTRSPKRLMRIWRRSNSRYLAYRTAVQVLSMAAGKLGKSIGSEARRNALKVMTSRNFEKDLRKLRAAGPFQVGVAFNLDQLLKKSVLEEFPLGVVNIHASKLPDGAGVAPALWAYARGEGAIWVSVYKMDTGIDTGPILEQFEVPIAEAASAFAAYETVCRTAGERLPAILDRYLRGDLAPRPQVRSGAESYYGWPDQRFAELMKENGQKFLRPRDISRVLRGREV